MLYKLCLHGVTDLYNSRLALKQAIRYAAVHHNMRLHARDVRLHVLGSISS